VSGSKIGDGARAQRQVLASSERLKGYFEDSVRGHVNGTPRQQILSKSNRACDSQCMGVICAGEHQRSSTNCCREQFSIQH
jgi:hypothetical protein